MRQRTAKSTAGVSRAQLAQRVTRTRKTQADELGDRWSARERQVRLSQRREDRLGRIERAKDFGSLNNRNRHGCDRLGRQKAAGKARIFAIPRMSRRCLVRGTFRNRRTVAAMTRVAMTVAALTGFAVLRTAKAVLAMTAAFRRRMVVKRMNGRRRHEIEGERKCDRNPLEGNHSPNSKPSLRGTCSLYYAPAIVNWEVQMQLSCTISQTFWPEGLGHTHA